MTQQRFAFVLRLWREAPAIERDQKTRLRGSVRLIDSERVLYLGSFEELPEILRELTGWQDEPDTSEDKGKKK